MRRDRRVGRGPWAVGRGVVCRGLLPGVRRLPSAFRVPRSAFADQGQHALQIGDVLAEELILEVDRRGGDDDRLAAGDGVDDGGEQVGDAVVGGDEGLPGEIEPAGRIDADAAHRAGWHGADLFHIAVAAAFGIEVAEAVLVGQALACEAEHLVGRGESDGPRGAVISAAQGGAFLPDDGAVAERAGRSSAKRRLVVVNSTAPWAFTVPSLSSSPASSARRCDSEAVRYFAGMCLFFKTPSSRKPWVREGRQRFLPGPFSS